MVGDTSNPKKVVTMRPVRILLVVVALLAVGLAGWAFGTRGGGYATPDASPSVTTAAPQGEPAAAPAPAPEPPDTTQPAPRPRIVGFGSEPVLPKDGTFWKLSPGPGLVTFVLDAQHATRVELWLTPTGTGVSDLSRKIGQDSDGRDGWLFNWNYPSEPILGHLTVRAIGPGGTAEKTVGITTPTPASSP